MGLPWGVGFPVLTLPTASNEASCESGKMEWGPGAVVGRVTTRQLVFGAVATNRVSFAGSSRYVNGGQTGFAYTAFMKNCHLMEVGTCVSSPVYTPTGKTPISSGTIRTVPIGGWIRFGCSR